MHQNQILILCSSTTKAKAGSGVLVLRGEWHYLIPQKLQNYHEPEWRICRSRRNSSNRTWNSGLGADWERSISSCTWPPCLFNSYAEYIVRNAGLDESQPGIKITRRDINNLRYTDDITLMAKIEEELKRLLMGLKEESEKAGLKLNIYKTKIMASSLITSWQIDRGKVETVTDLIWEGWGPQNYCWWWLQPWNSKMLALWKKSYDRDSI